MQAVARTVVCVLLLLPGSVLADKIDFDFPDAQTGKLLQLSAIPPQWTLVNFWRVDCEPCLREMPLLATFSRQQPQLRVLGISLSDKKSSAQQWKQQRMPYPTLVNTGFPGELLKQFGNTLAAVPYTALLTPDRSVCWSNMGELAIGQLEQGLLMCQTAKK